MLRNFQPPQKQNEVFQQYAFLLLQHHFYQSLPELLPSSAKVLERVDLALLSFPHRKQQQKKQLIVFSNHDAKLSSSRLVAGASALVNIFVKLQSKSLD